MTTDSVPNWRDDFLAQLQRRNNFEALCCGSLSQCCSDAIRRHNRYRDESHQLSADLEKERDTTDTLRRTVESLEQQYAPSKQNARIAELEAHNKSLQTQMQRTLESAQRVISLTDEVKNLQAKLERSDNAVREAAEVRAALEEANKKLTSDVESLRSVEAVLRTELSSSKDRLDSLTRDYNHITETVIQCKTQIVDLMNTNMELEQANKALTQSVEEARSRSSSHPPGGAPGTDAVDPGTNFSFTAREAHGFLDEGAIRRGAFATVPMGRKIRDIEQAHDGEINACVFSGDHNKLFTGGNDKVLKLWDVSSGDVAGSLTATGSILCLDYVKDMIIAGCADSVTRVYTVSAQRSRYQLTGHTDSVTAVSAAQDATKAYTGSKDRTLKQWDIKERGAFVWTRPCFSLCHDVSVANELVVTAHFDAVLRLWDSRQGTVTSEIKNAHSQPLTCVRYSPDAARLLTVGRDNAIKLWDARRYECYATLTHPDLAIPSNFVRGAWSGCGSFVVIGGANHVLVFSGQKAGPPCAILRNGHRGVINCVAWSEDGRTLCSVGHDKRVILWA